jgi:hypothetical protein
MQLNEGELVEVHIDLEELKNNKLNESFLTMFGSTIKMLLNSMFGPLQPYTNFSIKGTKSDVTAFARALGNEKKYLQSAKKHGLDNPKTLSSKTALTKAIKNFEKETGLKWPFK